MTENGKVIKVENGNAIVSFNRQSMCGDCSGCAVSKKNSRVDATLINDLGAEEGDIVSVEFSDKEVIKASFFAYLIPLIMATIGIVIGTLLSTELFAFALCILFLVLGFLITKVVTDRFVSRPKIIKIFDKDFSNSNCDK